MHMFVETPPTGPPSSWFTLPTSVREVLGSIQGRVIRSFSFQLRWVPEETLGRNKWE